MQPAANPPLLRGWTLVAMTLGLSAATFMEVLDTTVANVSLPTISGDLAVSATQGTWVITGYSVSNAITVLLAGWLAMRWGEVRMFTLCALAFGAASLLCGASTSLETLVAFRVLQGAVAGPMVAVTQSLLLRNYAPARRGLAMAIWTLTVVCAPLIGPVLGGYITDNFDWRWIFLINVPVAMLAAAAVRQTLRGRETDRQKLQVDFIGFGLVVVGVGALQVLLDKGKELDWFESPLIVVLGAVSAVALVSLVVWELGERAPVVNLRLFANRNVTVSITVMAFAYACMFAGVVLVPLMLQTQLGYTATWAGLTVAPMGFLALMLTPIVGPALPRMNLRAAVTAAMLIFALASFWRARLETGADYLHLALPQLVQGAAVAFFFAPLVIQYTSQLPPRLYASASSLMNFTRMLGAAVATSLVTTIWDRRAALHQSDLISHVVPGAPGYDSFAATLAAHGAHTAEVGVVVAQSVSQQAYMLAADDVFFGLGVIFLSLIPIAWLARPTQPTAALAGH